MEAFWGPKSVQNFDHFLDRVWIRFGCIFGSHFGYFGCPSWPKFFPRRLLRRNFCQKIDFRKTKENLVLFQRFFHPRRHRKRPKIPQDAPKTVLESYLFDVQNFDRFWFVLGSILVAFGDAFWVLLGTSWGSIWSPKTELSCRRSWAASWGRLGGVLGASREPLGFSQGLLGGSLEPLGDLLGALWSLLGASEGLFQRKLSKAKLSQATVG